MDKLLEILSENSSFTTKELSLMLGEPEDYIKAQIREYEQSGVIKGYHAIVDWEKVPDAGVIALIQLNVVPKKETGFDDVAKKLMAFDEVSSLQLMAGAFDFAVTVKGKTIQDVASFVARKLACLDGVSATATHFFLKSYKDNGAILSETESAKDGRNIVL